MRLDATANLEPAPGLVRRALFSVFDKTALAELAIALSAKGVEILASGGTATTLEKAGLTVVRIENFTGAKEVLDGRVKTLHPKIHAGLLADRRLPTHERDMNENAYPFIDLVVCNLYPFEQARARGAARHEMVENIDIGGPTLLRAAAKNEAGGVTVLMDPADYREVADIIARTGAVAWKIRRALAAKTFKIIAAYDNAIADWYAQDVAEIESPSGAHAQNAGSTASAPADSTLPERITEFTRVEVLRYGENPHQQGALYRATAESTGVSNGTLLSGKQLSYNNYLDMDGAYRAVFQLAGIGCSIVKHTNPCGLAEASTQPEAFRMALVGDPVSAFGGILGFNTMVERATAVAIKDSKLFVECIVAPSFDPSARDELAKKENLRLFEVPMGSPEPEWHAHRIGGGLLVETVDSGLGDTSTWEVVTKKKLESGWHEELAFAMRAAMLLKSNSIAVSKGRCLLGAGAGQMSRVDAAEQAFKKAGAAARGGFLGSDAFFPFDDVVKLAAAAGIVAIVQPGGSKRDADSIDACDAAGLAMAFTSRRHFKH
ncbi:MAG: bifunctional phosphoribosylaminoimidazolecarboxamide formyltransferase/IMP cyclohydrolase [Clostridia bacterium]|nr:bifunctional phosphoribosylaminoimidazolecarboxamide formyltransferase/IMP cyclohydrolase [Deltaproteobacteria bacterium]